MRPTLALVVPTGVLVAALASCSPRALTPETAAATTTGADAGSAVTCAQVRQCTDCPNDRFIPTECRTTAYGPARANIVTGAANFLYCDEGSYALCFYSGPPTAGGKDDQRLPCVVDESGHSAKCTCKAYSTGPYFVDIHAIENLRLYYQTIDVCGSTGAGCQNLESCGEDGRRPECGRLPQAPVCKHAKNQNPKDDRASLIPGADLVSTFSFAMASDYPKEKTHCHAGLYAGCMTAPCSFPGGKPAGPLNGQPVECKCPLWNGPFQIGQPGQACSIPPGPTGQSYVWSASYEPPRSTDAGRR